MAGMKKPASASIVILAFSSVVGEEACDRSDLLLEVGDASNSIMVAIHVL